MHTTRNYVIKRILAQFQFISETINLLLTNKMENISSLLERYFSGQNKGVILFFDVDEIASLINYFLEKEDSTNLNKIIELGYELHPDDINFKIALCKTLIVTEDFNSALKLIDEDDIKGNKDIDLIRIECLCELYRLNEALDLVNDLGNKGSSYFEEATEHMACVLNDIEKYQKEASCFIQDYLSIFPDNFVLKSELCLNHELSGNTKEALELCNNLIDEDPYSAEIWYMQGRLFSLCADFEKAIDSLDFAISCAKDNKELEYEIKFTKALFLYKNENYEKAISCYNELVSHEEFEASQVDPYLADCYISIDDYEKAYKILKEIIGNEDLDDEVSVLGNFIYCCIETDRKDEAIEILGEALKRFPHSILDYISTLNMIKSQHSEILTGKEKIIYPSELARNYINSSFHNN